MSKTETPRPKVFFPAFFLTAQNSFEEWEDESTNQDQNIGSYSDDDYQVWFWKEGASGDGRGFVKCFPEQLSTALALCCSELLVVVVVAKNSTQ